MRGWRRRRGREEEGIKDDRERGFLYCKLKWKSIILEVNCWGWNNLKLR